MDRAISLNAVLEICECSEVDFWSGEMHRKIEQLPPVTPQPKIGRWVKNDWTPICSCCGKYKYEDIDGSIYDDVWFPNYCPNCGAKMIEPREGSNKELQNNGKN